MLYQLRIVRRSVVEIGGGHIELLVVDSRMYYSYDTYHRAQRYTV